MSDANAPYPAPPWRLRGWGVASARMVDVTQARRFVPDGFAIVPVWPGKTLGGLCVFSYERGSTLVYRELAVVGALVRVGRRVGFWLPRLDVDDAASAHAGHAVWGLRKHFAQFRIEKAPDALLVTVGSDERTACRIDVNERKSSVGVRLPFALPLPAVGLRDGCPVFFTARLKARFTFARMRVHAPPDEVLAALGLCGSSPMALWCGDLRLNVARPHDG